jgi:RNA polymerase sigma-70 factor (ECF subfamily)
MAHYDEETIIKQLMNPATRRRAFEEVVRAHSEALYWQIRHMVLSHEDADDLLQNTFLKAWSNIESFRGDAKLSTWLHRIAINECLNFQRNKKATLSLQDEQSSVKELESDPYFDGDETQLQLQRAVESLPEKQRMVFRMKYFQEMKYEEMSEILGNSVGALKASYFHAVKKISAFFNAED